MWDEWETNLIVHQRVKTISAERLQGVHAPGKDMTIADDIMLKTKLSDCKLWLNLLVGAVVLAQAPLPCRPGQLSYNPCHPSSLLLLLEEDNAVRSWWQNNLHITGDSSIQDVMTKRRAKTIWPKIRLQKIDSNVALKMVRRKNWPGGSWRLLGWGSERTADNRSSLDLFLSKYFAGRQPKFVQNARLWNRSRV